MNDQKTLGEIFWNERLKYFSHVGEPWRNISDDLKLGTEAGVAAVIAEHERCNGWIPVSERIPTKADADRDGGILVTRWIGSIGFNHYSDLDEVKAWRRLPPPYTPPAPTPEEIERKEFEAWAKDHMMSSLIRSSKEEYESPWTCSAWQAWQAARKAEK